MKKSVYILFLLVFACFLCGCDSQKPVTVPQNSFRLIRQTNGQETALVYSLPLNSKKMEENGLTAQNLKIFRFYLASFVQSLAQQNQDKNVEGVRVSPCTLYNDIDSLGFTISFEDNDALQRFFNSNSNEKVAPKINGFFVKKATYNISFPFSIQTAQDLKQICKMAVESMAESENIKDVSNILSLYDESVFVYDFASKEKGLKSANFYQGKNFYHNVFIKDVKEIETNPTISLYASVPNVPVWYSTVLLCVILGMTTTYFVKTKCKKLQNRAKISLK